MKAAQNKSSGTAGYIEANPDFELGLVADRDESEFVGSGMEFSWASSEVTE